jgi:hypothetical protein
MRSPSMTSSGSTRRSSRSSVRFTTGRASRSRSSTVAAPGRATPIAARQATLSPLWQRVHGVNAWEAIEALAARAEIERGPTAPKPRRARSLRPGVAKGDGRIARADALWYARWLAPRRDPGIDERGQRYLASRGLSGLCEAIGTWRYHHLTFKGDGSPSTPIYTLERVSSYDSSAMINVAERLVAPSPTGPKVLVMKDHPTKFSFGRPDLLLAHSNLQRVVLVEGVMDYLTALALWPPGGPVLVLGAHAGRAGRADRRGPPRRRGDCSAASTLAADVDPTRGSRRRQGARRGARPLRSSRRERDNLRPRRVW